MFDIGWDCYLSRPPRASASTQEQKIAVKLVITKAMNHPHYIELRRILFPGQPLVNRDYLTVPAWLNRIDDDLLQVIVDKHQLSQTARQLYFTSTRVKLMTPRKLVEKRSVNGGAVLPPISFLPSSFALCQYRQYFHHFLRYRTLSK